MEQEERSFLKKPLTRRQVIRLSLASLPLISSVPLISLLAKASVKKPGEKVLKVEPMDHGEMSLQERRLRIGENWTTGEKVRLFSVAPLVEEHVAKTAGLNSYLPTSIKEIFVDKDITGELRQQGLGGRIIEGKRIQMPQALTDLEAYRELPHEFFHSLGDLAGGVLGGGKFWREGPATYIGDALYTKKVDPDFIKRGMEELPPEKALNLTLDEARKLSKAQKYLAWRNIWYSFEKRAEELGRPIGLAAYLKKRGLERENLNNSLTLDQVLAWGEEWVPGFAKEVNQAPICEIEG